MQRLLDEANGGFLAERSVPADIGPLIVLIPLAIFVLPPLAGAVAVMTCWPRARKEGRAPRRRGRGRDAPSESVSGDSSAAEAVGARAGGGDAVGGGQAEEADLAHV